MKPRNHPGQGSLFGGPPEAPTLPVPPERVQEELPGQLFLPVAPPILPALDVIKAAQSIADAGAKGWEFYPGTGAPTFVRRLGRALAVVKLWGGAAYWSAKRTDNAERTEGCEDNQADAERAATAALERLVNSYDVP